MLNRINLTTPSFKSVIADRHKLANISDEEYIKISKQKSLMKKTAHETILHHKDDAWELSTIIRLAQNKVPFTYIPKD